MCRGDSQKQFNFNTRSSDKFKDQILMHHFSFQYITEMKDSTPVFDIMIHNDTEHMSKLNVFYFIGVDTIVQKLSSFFFFLNKRLLLFSKHALN